MPRLVSLSCHRHSPFAISGSCQWELTSYVYEYMNKGVFIKHIINCTNFNSTSNIYSTKKQVYIELISHTTIYRCYPTLAREFQGFRVWGKFVFRTLELTDTPTNSANQIKVGHALDQTRSGQSRGPERAPQNNAQWWRSSRTDRRLSRQFWEN